MNRQINTATNLRTGTDNYFMLANWRAFLQDGFYVRDPLSMHQEYRCSLEKWLRCAMFYGLYEAGGLPLLRIVLAARSVAITCLLYRLCLYTSGNRMLSLAFTELMLLTGGIFLGFRPQTVTVLLLLAKTLILEPVVRERRWRLLFFLPVLSWLEMQLHSTIWPCFFLVLCPYILDVHQEDGKILFDKKKIAALAATALACAGTLFLNPYGAWSVFYIFRSYGDPFMKASIGELNSTVFFQYGSWAVWFFVILLAFAIGDKKMPVRYYLLCFGFISLPGRLPGT